MDSSGISDLFEDSIQLSPNDITFTLNPGEVDEPQETNQVLLGRIINRYKFGKAAIQGSLNLSWKAVKGWKWKEIEEGLLQFTFARREDAMNVLARRPWFVCGALMVLMPWPAWLTPAEVRFDKTPMWVTVESIPPFYWNLSNLQEMAAKASPVHELPAGIEDAIGMSNLRFRATIDINKPIFCGFFLRRQKLKDLWIQYKYEKLPKLCFKCGVLSHEQSSCFKAPTVVKDSLGNFYPLYGTWLRNDAKEKSTFTTPLAKWFQDWVLQKRLGKDPVLCNQVKVQKAIRNGEEAEIRECRMQLPSKRRIVADSDEEHDREEPEMVITQLPMVYLPGIGEISPFGQNSKQVKVQDLIDAAAPSEGKKTRIFTIKGSSSKGNTLHTNHDNDVTRIKEDLTISVGNNMKPLERDTQSTHLKEKHDSDSSLLPEDKLKHSTMAPTTEMEKVCLSPYKASILGTQAQIIPWPSNECWAQDKARELLFGSLTVDKFHREPQLFNPILNIEDFRVQEHLEGPRKRKASDGIMISPTPISNNETNTDSPVVADRSKEDTTKESQNSLTSYNHSQSPGTFALGQGSVEPSPRRRGRPRKLTSPNSETQSSPLQKRRGKSTSSTAKLSSTPKKFKTKASKTKRGFFSSIKNQWHGQDFDLKIDLNNHFVFTTLCNKLHFTGSHYIPPIGLSGGLGLCWLTGVQCKIHSANKFVIVGEISSDPPGANWLFLGTYGPPHATDKEEFWRSIGDMVLLETNPILIVGDLNGTLQDSECTNYTNSGNSSRYAFDFRRMVNRTGLIDLGFVGPGYTWSRGNSRSPGTGSLKRARLDRGLVTTDWRLLFPAAIVNHLSSSVSDHRPILLDTNGGVMCKGRLFKYENMWNRDPRSCWVVKEAWMNRLHTNPMINFHRKIKNTSRRLRRWNKTHFKDIKQQIHDATSVLRDLETKISSQSKS
ncbi:hypothetical protein G4B88_028677 [Cannabis sativa]|uniref:DUF4283 domain-containing protein n=1 Tax=Cannabis sativa TaxID=3483 RepID=A0A7J6ENQ2_CANSA|nr:hypothetical protein G4B88_028677 [Cannabis sativa]